MGCGLLRASLGQVHGKFVIFVMSLADIVNVS